MNDNNKFNAVKEGEESSRQSDIKWYSNKTLETVDSILNNSTEQLPILEYREEIEKMIIENQTSIIIGHTWSGKTTKIPEIALNILPQWSRILVSQPRRLPATSVSKYVAEQMWTGLWDKVWYQIRFDSEENIWTNINFATDGIILAALQSDPLLHEYDCVIVDEAHERSLNIDFLLWLLKRAQKDREEKWLPELKVIVTSATIEKEKFQEYFQYAPSLEVPGRLYPVEIAYLEQPTKNIEGVAAETVKYICETKWENWDILIFMPWKREIDKTIWHIDWLWINDLDVMPLYWDLDPESQNKIFKKGGNRKVIVSTNIAETSLTLPWVKYVIDSWLIKQTNYNPNSKITSLESVEHSKAWCTQRTWRAWRVWPGKCFRLYTEREFETRESFSKPEIMRSDLWNIVLKMRDMNIDVNDFDFVDIPDANQLNEAVVTLRRLWGLDDNWDITELGKSMVKIPLEPHLSRMLIESEKYDATNEVSTIMAFLSTRNVFVRPKWKEYYADESHKQFKDDESDFITFLNVWNAYQLNNWDKSWCNDNYINHKVIQEVQQVRYQLLSVLRKIWIYSNTGSASKDKIQKSITAGMIDYIMINNSRSYSFSNLQNWNNGIFIHPSSWIFSNRPQLMIAEKIMTTSKTFAMNCQKIEIEDIKEFAPYLISQINNWSFKIDESTWDVSRNIVYMIWNEQVINNESVLWEEAVNAILLYVYTYLQSFNYEQAEFIRELYSLFIRSGGDTKFDLTKDDFISILSRKIWDNVEQSTIIPKIRSWEITITEEDLWITSEDIERFDKMSPRTIVIKGEEYGVMYYMSSWETHAKIEARSVFLDLENTDLEKLGRINNLEYTYNSKTFLTLDRLKDEIIECKIKESLNELNMKSSEKYSGGEMTEEFMEDLLKRKKMSLLHPTWGEIPVYLFLEYFSGNDVYLLRYTLNEENAISRNKLARARIEGQLIEKFKEENPEKINTLRSLTIEIKTQLENLWQNGNNILSSYEERISELKYSEDLSSLEKEMNDYFLWLKEKWRELQKQLDNKNVLKDFWWLLRVSWSTDNKDYWVIDREWNIREYDSIEYPKSHKRWTPTVNWKIVEADEIALYWSKDNSASEHYFEVKSMVVSWEITEAQRDAIYEIEESIENRWKDYKWLSSWSYSPSIWKWWWLTWRKDDTTPLMYRDSNEDDNSDNETQDVNENNPFAVLKNVKFSNSDKPRKKGWEQNITPNKNTEINNKPTESSLNALLAKFKK